MPDVTARDRYLDDVAGRLRLPDDLRDEVIEELATHLADATDDGVAHGVSFDAAERDAIERMGPADALADRLRRTHQTTRRLFAAVGGGVWAAARDGLRGYIAALVLLLVVVSAWSVLSAIGVRVQVWSNGTSSTAVGGLLAWVAVWWAASGMVRAVATRSRRRIVDVWPLVAAGGAAVLAVPILTVQADYDWPSAVIVGVIPLVFALSAARLGRGGVVMPGAWDRLHGWVILAAVLAVVVAAGAGLLASGSTAETPAGSPVTQTSPEAIWATNGYDRVAASWVGAVDVYLEPSSFGAAGMPQAIVVHGPSDTLAGVREPTLEAWPAGSHADGTGRWDPYVDPAATGPIAAAAILDPHLPTTIAVHRDRDARGYLLMLVGRDPASGERVLVGQPWFGDTVFHGSLIDWLGAG